MKAVRSVHMWWVAPLSIITGYSLRYMYGGIKDEQKGTEAVACLIEPKWYVSIELELEFE